MADTGLPSLGLSLPPVKLPTLGPREVNPLPQRAAASSIGTTLTRTPRENRTRSTAQLLGPNPNQALLNRGSAVGPRPTGSQVPQASPMAMPQVSGPMMVPNTGTPAQPMPTRPVNGGGYYHQLRGSVLDHLQVLQRTTL